MMQVVHARMPLVGSTFSPLMLTVSLSGSISVPLSLSSLSIPASVPLSIRLSLSLTSTLSFHLDDARGARAHAVGGEDIRLPEDCVEQSALPRPRIAHRHKRGPGHAQVPACAGRMRGLEV